MYVPPEFINTLVDRLTIFDVVSKYVPLVRQGSRYYGCCPFHNEKTPSFHINLQKNSYVCYGCKEYGNIYTFIQKLKSVDFITAVEILANQAGLEIPKASSEDQAKQLRVQEYLKIMQAAQDFFEKQLASNAGKGARAYLEKRQINASIVKRFGLGFSGSGTELKDHLTGLGYTINQLRELSLLSKEKSTTFYRNRLMFPIYNKQKKVIAFGGRTLGSDEPKYINSAETELYSKSNNLYGFAQAIDSNNRNDPIIVVEGYIDVITMHQYGFDKTVAPLGTALTPNQIKMIWTVSPMPIICFDGDSAGMKAAGVAACNTLPILRSGCSLKFAHLPDALDPDDYLNRYGRIGLSEVFEKSKPLSQFLWRFLKSQHPSQLPEEKAKWHDEITQKLSTIEHDIIRTEYFNAFKEWGYQTSESPPKFNANEEVKKVLSQSFQHKIKNYSKSYSVSTGQNLRSPIHSKSMTFQKLLLMLPINFPEILVDIYEYLSNIDFKNDNFNNIRDILLDYTNEEHVKNMPGITTYLRDQGINEIPFDLLLQNNMLHVSKLKETPTASCAKQYWIELYAKLNEPSRSEQRKALIDQSKEYIKQN